jgi:hypothetical protein
MRSDNNEGLSWDGRKITRCERGDLLLGKIFDVNLSDEE